jgi:hypothetical protein
MWVFRDHGRIKQSHSAIDPSAKQVERDGLTGVAAQAFDFQVQESRR